MQGYIVILKGAQSEDDEVERVLNWDLLPQAAEVIAKAMIAMAEQEGIELTNDNVDEYFEKAHKNGLPSAYLEEVFLHYLKDDLDKFIFDVLNLFRPIILFLNILLR